MAQDRLRLQPDECDLLGQWMRSGSSAEGDAVCRRIEELTAGVLEPLAVSLDGWSRLYRDPFDLRLWEETYPSSDRHGGGPPRLSVIAEVDAVLRYTRPWGRAAVERGRVGHWAEQYLAGRMSFEDFMLSLPDAPLNEQVAELIDLIEHEPKKGGLFGARQAEYDQHMARIGQLVNLLLERAG